jgi:hypothetical protein
LQDFREDSKFQKKSVVQKIKFIEDEVRSITSFIETTEDEEFTARFKVTLGSGGIKEYHERLEELLNNR